MQLGAFVFCLVGMHLHLDRARINTSVNVFEQSFSVYVRCFEAGPARVKLRQWIDRVQGDIVAHEK